ncbi:MAG: ABC transporter ATP-binding protein [Candidatus Nanopelagicales bacterium]|nr:ABC transporter ATP-binding protein [Candidatus Nanopelagicales bacterium]
MPEVLSCSDIVVRRGTRHLVDHVDWVVREGERWVVLGPNGAGKTTLMMVASGRMFPTSGQVEILGERLGRTDLAELRPLIGWASSAMVNDVPPGERVADVVLTGAYAVTGRWREQYEGQDLMRAAALMHAWGIGALATRTFGTLSEGERKRTMIARALMSNPEILLLDEPGAGLDLGGREDLVARMSELALDPTQPSQILITHHVEEIPAGFTHALLIRDGAVVASGPIDEVVTGPWLSATFGLPVRVTRVGDRFLAVRDA